MKGREKKCEKDFSETTTSAITQRSPFITLAQIYMRILWTKIDCIIVCRTTLRYVYSYICNGIALRIIWHLENVQRMRYCRQWILYKQTIVSFYSNVAWLGNPSFLRKLKVLCPENVSHRFLCPCATRVCQCVQVCWKKADILVGNVRRTICDDPKSRELERMSPPKSHLHCN